MHESMYAKRVHGLHGGVEHQVLVGALLLSHSAPKVNSMQIMTCCSASLVALPKVKGATW